MKNIRIIPRLDIKGPNVVKGIHLEGLRVVGEPKEFAKFYYESGADELLYMDVVASLYNRNSLKDIIEETAKELFIPLTVGGGLRTIDDIRSVLNAGADKVVLNTAAIKNPQLIKEASEKFGSSTIVIAIEAIRQENGKYFAFIDNGREFTGKEVVDWALEAEELGAGELLITSVDNEGTGAGYNYELISEVSNVIKIPVIVHGGAGNINHVKDVIEMTKIDAVAISSLFHYETLKNLKYSKNEMIEGNQDFLRSGASNTKIKSVFIGDLKNFLRDNGIDIRI